MKLLYILTLFQKRNKKIEAILRFFEFFRLSQHQKSIVESQIQYALQHLIQEEISKHYRENSVNSRKFEKALEFDSLSLKMIQSTNNAAQIAFQMWSLVKNDETELNCIMALNKRLYLQTKKVEQFMRQLKTIGTPTTHLYRLYYNFVRNVMHDNAKTLHFKELLEQNKYERFIRIHDVNLSRTKFLSGTAKTFFVISGDPGRYGIIKYASEEVKQILEIDAESCINRNIGKLKPMVMEHFYKNWITDFYENGHQYNDIINDCQFFDLYFDAEMYLKIFLANVRMVPSFNQGVEFIVFLSQVQTSSNDAGVIIFNKQLGNIIGFNRYITEEFRLAPQLLEIDDSNGINIMNVWSLFEGLEDLIDQAENREGVRHILRFYPYPIIADMLENKKASFTEATLRSLQSKTVLKKSQSVNDLRTYDDPNVKWTIKESLRFDEITDYNVVYQVSVEVTKFLKIEDENYVFLTIKNSTGKIAKSIWDIRREAAIQKSQTPSITQVSNKSTSELSINLYLNEPMVDDGSKFSKAYKFVLLLIFVELILIGIALAFKVLSMRNSLEVLEFVKMESLQQNFLVQSYVVMQNGHQRSLLINNTDFSIFIMLNDIIYNRFRKAHTSFIKQLNNYSVIDPVVYSGISAGSESFDSIKAYYETSIYLNVTDFSLQYSLYPLMFFEQIMRQIRNYLETQNDIAYQFIEENFFEMFDKIKGLIIGLMMMITPIFDDFHSKISVAVYMYLSVILLKLLLSILFVIQLDRNLNHLFYAFFHVTPKEANRFVNRLLVFTNRHIFTKGNPASSSMSNFILNSQSNNQLPSESLLIQAQSSRQAFTNVSSSVRDVRRDNDSKIERNKNHQFEASETEEKQPVNKRSVTKTRISYYGVKRRVLQYGLQLFFGLVIFILLLTKMGKESIISTVIIKDAMLTSEIISNFSLIKLLQIKPFFKQPCSDCLDKLMAANVQVMNLVSTLQNSIERYSEPEFQLLKDFSAQVKNDFCGNFALKVDPNVYSYAGICNDAFSLRHSLLASISQTFNNYQTMVAPGFDIVSNLNRWGLISLSLGAFSQYFAQIHTYYKDIMQDWNNNQIFYFSLYLTILVILHLLANYLYLVKLKDYLAIKLKVRNQVIRLLRAPLISKNRVVMTFLPESNEPNANN